MQVTSSDLPKRKARCFLSEDFMIDKWENIQPYYQKLLDQPINSFEEFYDWLKKMDETNAVIAEQARWLMIKGTCNTTDKDIQEKYSQFIKNINPHLTEYNNKISLKLIASPYLAQLDDKVFMTFVRGLRSKVALFREKNLPIQTTMKLAEKEYGKIIGAMTITIDDEELTLPQARQLLMDKNRAFRKEAFLKTQERQLVEKEKLNDLFSRLVKFRNQIALNADFDNFRDYKFADLGRFDYTPEDCFGLHEAVGKEIVPLVKELHLLRKEKLGFDTLKPWDTSIDIWGKAPLKPFKDSKELVAKTIECLSKIRPVFGKYLATMEKMGHLDLESRKGKAPGGYNCPLPETGIPFIFMNAVGTARDLTVMVHEGGHAIHSFLSHAQPFSFLKRTPSEVAELASMTMELFSMEHWNIFYSDEQALIRAKITQLTKVISSLPWMMTIDKFQHWLYTHPNHTSEEREKAWLAIQGKFSTKIVDWSGLEEFKTIGWQKQLHLFEVPFYYIEYSMAQLGAIAMWKQFRENREQAIENYISALKLGYSAPIGKIYETAGIDFNFSKEYVSELGQFVMKEIKLLYKQLEDMLVLV